jgi:Zn-dependent peptidase ImmA (M78 family)
MNTVAASVPVLRWAANRARLHDDDIAVRFRKWHLWLAGEAAPTLKQLEDFARLTHTAVGYFFLPAPPNLVLPVPDFRTIGDAELREPSTNLLDTVYLCQQRQDWYRDHARLQGLPALDFVGSATLQTPVAVAAERLRVLLGFTSPARGELSSWSEALRHLVSQADNAGVLVMVSSVVGSNTHRKLNVDEFRGFALADDLAPLIFVNGDDSKAAQMFTLAHELAHILLGETGVSDLGLGTIPTLPTERWCNQVAAELLVPMNELRESYESDIPVPTEIQRLARKFKVSTLVALRRLFDAGYVSEAALWQLYREEQARLRSLKPEGRKQGGDYYNSLGARTSKRFARAIIGSTLEGFTSFPEAFRMLGMRQTSTFNQAARELGVVL